METPGENPLGDHLDAGGGGGLLLEADLVPHGPPSFLAAAARHPAGRIAGSKAPGFEHDNAPPPEKGGIQEGKGDAGRLAGAGGGNENDRGVGCQGVEKLGKNPVYGKGWHFGGYSRRLRSLRRTSARDETMRTAPLSIASG